MTRTIKVNTTEDNRLTITSIIPHTALSIIRPCKQQWPTLNWSAVLTSHRYMASGSPFTVYFVSVIAEGSRKVVMLIRKMDSTVPEYMKKQPPFGVNICWDICLWRVVIPRIEKFSERVA